MKITLALKLEFLLRTSLKPRVLFWRIGSKNWIRYPNFFCIKGEKIEPFGCVHLSSNMGFEGAERRQKLKIVGFRDFRAAC